MNIADLTITSFETITAFDIATGNLKFVLDELQNATIANSQEKSDITGKGGRKLSSIKRNKAVTISGTNGMLSGGQILRRDFRHRADVIGIDGIEQLLRTAQCNLQ